MVMYRMMLVSSEPTPTHPPPASAHLAKILSDVEGPAAHLGVGLGVVQIWLCEQASM